MQKLLTKLSILSLQALACLPLGVLYVISDVIYLAVYRLARYRLHMVRANLQLAFPEKSDAERKEIERQFYRGLADVIVETIKMLHISDEEMKRRVEVVDSHLIDQLADEDRPAFLMIGHMGNWEWVQEVTKRLVKVQVYGELYHPLSSKTFDEVMSRIRARYQTVQIPQKQAVRTILQMKREHGSFLIGFIADQRPTRRSLTHWTTFLGQDTPYVVGAEEIGHHVNAKCLYLDVERTRRGHYRMVVKELDMNRLGGEETDHPQTVAYLRMLEQNIREHPELWLWSHNRWKHKRN
jgi:KDO2-lipid IV(A) lauroyltransferase